MITGILNIDFKILRLAGSMFLPVFFVKILIDDIVITLYNDIKSEKGKLQMKKLGDTEIEIMKILWEKSAPVTSGEILEELNVNKNWKLSSLMTALDRLAAKGFLVCDRSTRTNYYSAVITKVEYQTEESNFFLEKIFSGSVQKLVANLYDGETINKEDLTSLKQWIEEELQKEGQ